MTTQSLQNIIQIENELHAKEQAEQEKVANWLQEKEESLAAEHQARLDELAGKKEKVKEQARKEAEKKASDIIKKAQERAAVLDGLDDDTLCRYLEKHFLSIITGNIP